MLQDVRKERGPFSQFAPCVKWSSKQGLLGRFRIGARQKHFAALKTNSDKGLRFTATVPQFMFGAALGFVDEMSDIPLRLRWLGLYWWVVRFGPEPRPNNLLKN